MKYYTIIGGISGTGKSGLSGILRSEVDNFGKLIDSDNLDFIHDDMISDGISAEILIENCLDNGICFAQETTLADCKIPETAKIAGGLGYYVRLYYVGLNSLEESLKRVKNRVVKGGRNVSAEIVAKQFETRFSDVEAVLAYCNEATFYDNENGFQAVAKYVNGKLDFIGEVTPNWMISLAEYLNLFEKIEDEYDISVYEAAHKEYEDSGKVSRPVWQLWQELDL